MPQYANTPDFVQRVQRLEGRVAALLRSQPRLGDEVPFFPTGLHTLPYESATTFTTMWETVLTPRTTRLSLGLVFIGDQVSTTNTGGDWQVLVNDLDVVASGSVAATFSFQFASPVIDLTPYLPGPDVKVSVQSRRTSGATTGGRYGSGGAIGLAPRYARLI
jgi:hypothetical protein